MNNIINIEQETLNNNNFRKVLYTTKNIQLVVMSLLPNEEIGTETHHLDQFFKVEIGSGKAVLDGEEYIISNGYAVIIPAGVEHNIINTDPVAHMKLYTIYSPPNHENGVIHSTKREAEVDEEHFEGMVME